MLKKIDIKKELKKLDDSGFIPTKRKGDTGIGYTLETLLGIKENNLGEPDFIYNNKKVELKAQRDKATNRITLVTKVPKWKPYSAKEIIEKFGYKDKKGRQALKIILKVNEFNAKGFKLEINEQNNKLEIVHKVGGIVSFFDIDVLMEVLKIKIYNNLLLVVADSKKINNKEHFHYKKAILLSDLDENSFKKLLKNGSIVWEFRMHIKKTGIVRDHGPGFRIHRNIIANLYKNKKEIYP